MLMLFILPCGSLIDLKEYYCQAKNTSTSTVSSSTYNLATQVFDIYLTY